MEFDRFPKYMYVQCSCIAGLKCTKKLDGDRSSIRAKHRITVLYSMTTLPQSSVIMLCAAWYAAMPHVATLETLKAALNVTACLVVLYISRSGTPCQPLELSSHLPLGPHQ